MVAVMSGCRKMPQHGDFSGQWQILTLTHPDGTIEQSNKEYFYRFYRDVAQLDQTGMYPTTANLDWGGDDFTLQFPYDNAAFLAPWGIIYEDGGATAEKGFTLHYTINHLSSSQLIMTTDQGVTITCRKF